MRPDPKTSASLAGVGILFLGLTAVFLFDLWGRPAKPAPATVVADEFTNTATVRMSAAELIRTDGDTSGLMCSACHDGSKKPQVRFDAEQNVILPEEHNDLVLAHGRNKRNNHCFNCHDSENMEMLRTRDGTLLKIHESNQLCGSCHGPTLRDWEVGIHGRVSGFWDKSKGPSTKQDCASCHDPHSPAFPPIAPAPAPQSRGQTIKEKH